MLLSTKDLRTVVSLLPHMNAYRTAIDGKSTTFGILAKSPITSYSCAIHNVAQCLAFLQNNSKVSLSGDKPIDREVFISAVLFSSNLVSSGNGQNKKVYCTYSIFPDGVELFKFEDYGNFETKCLKLLSQAPTNFSKLARNRLLGVIELFDERDRFLTDGELFNESPALATLPVKSYAHYSQSLSDHKQVDAVSEEPDENTKSDTNFVNFRSELLVDAEQDKKLELVETAVDQLLLRLLKTCADAYRSLIRESSGNTTKLQMYGILNESVLSANEELRQTY